MLNPIDAREELERLVLIALVGRAAERRSRHSSDPGWLRLRTFEEMVALHEAAHAVAASSSGRIVVELSVTPNLERKFGGFCKSVHPSAPKSKKTGPAPGVLMSDIRQAVELCWVLGPSPTWKDALRTVRARRATAAAFVDKHWDQIEMLAIHLRKRRHLDEKEISKLLPRGDDGSLLPAVATRGRTVENVQGERSGAAPNAGVGR